MHPSTWHKTQVVGLANARFIKPPTQPQPPPRAICHLPACSSSLIRHKCAAAACVDPLVAHGTHPPRTGFRHAVGPRHKPASASPGPCSGVPLTLMPLFGTASRRSSSVISLLFCFHTYSLFPPSSRWGACVPEACNHAGHYQSSLPSFSSPLSCLS